MPNSKDLDENLDGVANSVQRWIVENITSLFSLTLKDDSRQNDFKPKRYYASSLFSLTLKDDSRQNDFKPKRYYASSLFSLTLKDDSRQGLRRFAPDPA